MYPERTRGLVEEALGRMGITGALVEIQDQGAILPTLKARIKTALSRAVGGGEG